MKRRSSRAMRARVDRLMPVHARMRAETLPEDFTRDTMARVRCAKARLQQQESLAPRTSRRDTRLNSAAIALAGLTVAAALAASITFNNAPVAEPVVVADLPVAPAIDLPRIEINSSRDAVMNSRFVQPIRSEAEAIIDTGRSMGVAMLSALPAQPRAWSERLTDPTGR